MKSTLILTGLAAIILSSCSTSYRSGQTPDDVYFSPAREQAAYVQVEQQREEPRYRNYDDTYTSSDDRWLRMRIRNRSRWSAFDDYDWVDYRQNNWNNYNPYSYSYNNYFNNYLSWNSWYNPYCPRVVVVDPKSNPVVYNKVRNFNLNSYTNNNYNNSSRTTGMKPVGRGVFRPSYSNTQSSNSSSLGNSIRKVFSNSSTREYSTESSSSRPNRTYTPSTNNNSSSNNSSRSSSNSSSSGSSGSSSSGGGVSRPVRGGN